MKTRINEGGWTHTCTDLHTHAHSRVETLKKCQVFSNTIVPGVLGPLASGGTVGKPALGHCESIYTTFSKIEI